MTNAFGRGLIKLSDEGTFKAVKKLYVKKGTDWRDAKTAWIKQNGEWIQVYPTPVAEISIDPPTLNFEAANGYESPTQYINITNNGTEDLIIENFTTSYTVGGKFVTFFDLEELGGQLPATIAPGETKRLGIAIDAGSGAAFVQQDFVVMVDTPTLKTVNILCPLASIDVDYLVVAGGGGGGGGRYAGAVGTFYGQTYYLGNAGGGAGGVVVGYKKSIKRGETVKVTVGQGGAGGAAYRQAVPKERTVGANGGNSSFGDIVAIGGGGGGSGSVGWGNGQPGGSGGGAISFGGVGGAGTSGQGFSGSSGMPQKIYGYNMLGYVSRDGESGGGGGAGGVGVGSSGGPGRASTITGTRQYYGGGGGGANGPWGSTVPDPGVGGVGGGGNGGAPGTANTGGGGGGGLIGLIVYPLYSSIQFYPGGNGGSGVVVIKYEYDVQLGQGGTVTTYTTDDGVKNWVHTFTQDGTFTYNEVFETRQITVTEQVATTTQQLVQTNAGELGSSESTIRIKTNVGAFGTRYVDYTIYGNVVPQYAEIDILPANDITMHYYRYNPRPARQEIIVTNIGTGSLIITDISFVTQYFKIIAFPDAVAPQMTGIIVIEAGATEQTEPGYYTDVLTIKSNDIKGDNLINMTLEVRFPAGNVRISTAGLGYWTVPEGVYRLSEVRVIGAGGGGGQGFNQQYVPRLPNPNDSIVIDYAITGTGGIRTSSGGSGTALNGSLTVYQGEFVTIIVAPGGSSRVVITYQNANQVGSGGNVTSYTIDGLIYWAHTFTSSRSFSYGGLDPVLFGGVGSRPVIIPGAGSGGGGGSGSITLVANVEVIAGDNIQYVVGRGGAGVDPILSTTNPAPSGKPGQGTSFYNSLISAAGGLGGGGGGPDIGGVGASNTPNPIVSGIPLVPRTLSYAWSSHMNTYAVWDNPSDAGNSWYTFRKFTPTATDNYTFHLSCDNYGVLYLDGTVILSTTSFSSVTSTTVELTKDKINIIGMYAQNWGGPCGYALHITDSTGKVVWDTRTYRAPQVIESLPGAVSRKGGAGQNGTAGVGNGGHGGSNTLGLGGTPGLYNAPPPAGSVYFANQSSLVSGNNSNLVMAGDFTVECWIKQTGRPGTWNGVFEIGQWPNYPILLRCYGVDLDFWYGPGVGQIYPYVNINQWHHIAISRSGSLMRVYVDGVARLSASYGGTLNPGGAPITIGAGTHDRGRTGFTGYISNFRFVNGTALYTDTFTPPREVLKAVPGTVVLACQTNDTTLNSTGLVALSKIGNPINSDEMPFEVINKPVTLSAGGPGRGPGTGGGGGASGVDGQFTPASGAGADGEIYIEWGPIPPRDPPPNLVAHFVVNMQEQRMYDRVLPYCNPYVMQTSGFFIEKDRPYALFNGTANNYIGTPADPKYDLVRATTLSFTIEAWILLKGAGQYPYYGGEIINRDAEYEVAISQNDQVIVAIDWGVGTDVNLPGSGWIIPPAGKAVVPRNVPTHVAVVADKTTLYIYLNGKLEYTTGLNRVARRDNTPVWIGNRPGQVQGFNGGIADVRIWNVARTQAQIQTYMQALIYNTPQGI